MGQRRSTMTSREFAIAFLPLLRVSYGSRVQAFRRRIAFPPLVCKEDSRPRRADPTPFWFLPPFPEGMVSVHVFSFSLIGNLTLFFSVG